MRTFFCFIRGHCNYMGYGIMAIIDPIKAIKRVYHSKETMVLEHLLCHFLKRNSMKRPGTIWPQSNCHNIFFSFIILIVITRSCCCCWFNLWFFDCTPSAQRKTWIVAAVLAGVLRSIVRYSAEWFLITTLWNGMSVCKVHDQTIVTMEAICHVCAAVQVT